MSKLKNPLSVFQSAKTTGDLLKAFRINFKMTQDQFARLCGMSAANLSAIENGRRDVGPKTALRFSAALGVSPEIILYPNGFENEPEYCEVEERLRA